MVKGIGVIGGYIASEKNIIDLIRLFSSEFIFTKVLSLCIVVGCITSVNYIRNFNEERIGLKEKTKYLREKLR